MSNLPPVDSMATAEGGESDLWSLRLSAPRVDQVLSLNEEDASSYVETMSHFPSTHSGRTEAESRARSIYSYRSTRDGNEFTQESLGRIINTLNNMYLLPTDEVEWARLDRQHAAFRVAMSGELVPCPEIVDALLAPNGAETKRILDIGCGTGTWSVEMALKYPHSLVKGIDIAPVPLDPSYFPANLSFEIDDVNHGLQHLHGQFDLVHLRLVRSGFSDVYKVMEDIQRVLKPGGLFLVVDVDAGFYDEDHKPAKLAKVDGDEEVDGVSEDGSWLARIFWEQIEAIKLTKSDWDGGLDFMDLGIWDQQLLDPETAACGSLYFPTSPWAHSKDPEVDRSLTYVGTIMRQVTMNVQRAFHSSLGRYGMQQDILDDWSKKVDEELEQMKFHYFIRFTFCWARRRADNGDPAPPLPPRPAADLNHSDSGPPNGSFPSPFLEIFTSTTEAQTAKEKRLTSSSKLPTPAVQRAHANQTRDQDA